MVLDSAAVTIKGVLMQQIANTIRARYNQEGEVIFADIYSDDNAPTLVLRIGLVNDPDEQPMVSIQKRRRSNVAVLIVRVIFISSFFFYCLL